ncbi:hypothetical protein [Roseibacillus ishigakijimensis]|uniref:Uncharacterized protein n=1 Tax=Roseibacillus ishigakijimensis TaxID=454146 RepID=A0A934RLK3_9BACT|nr:hypothetical protein [Roseibacillus ishigakijimensis]MBK1833005.1 hypothetical protein [Roseibacillus ishigakijimensis]
MTTVEEGFAALEVQGARSTGGVLKQSDHGAVLGTSSQGGHGFSPLPSEVEE